MIFQMNPSFDENEANALHEYMSSGGWVTEFRKTKEFEDLIAEFTGSKHCILTNNGTISLTLMAIAAGIQAGDEVIVPNYTMIATPNSLKLFGAKPVFVDVEKETLCLDIEKVKEAITAKTKAIILVSANGRYPKVGIEAFKELTSSKNLVLLEDAAQSLGSTYPDGKHIGTAGLCGSFSFSAPKIISTGQGGAIITDDDAIAAKIRKLKDFGRASGGNDIHEDIGWNFKFTDIQAVIGIEQMKKLPDRIKRKKEIFEVYYNNLKDVSEIKLFEHKLEHTAPWFIDSRCSSRDSLRDYMAENNIGARVMYPPINRQKAYQLEGSYPVCEEIGEKGLWLPSSSELTDEQIILICNTIKKFYSL